MKDVPLTPELQVLVAEHYRLAYAAAQTMRPILIASGVDMEDAVASAWIDMCRRAPGYNPERGSPQTYFYTVCRSAILHEVKIANAKRRHGKTVISYDEPVENKKGEDGVMDVLSRGADDFARRASVRHDPARFYEVKEELSIRLSILSERDRNLFFKQQAGYSLQEIADMTGFTRRSVGQYIHKANSRMREVAC